MKFWRRDLARMSLLLLGASLVGILANALSKRPVPLLAADGPGAWPERESRVTVEELEGEWRLGHPILLLDVRSTESFEQGHARRAVSAPAAQFLEHYSRLGLHSILQAADGVVVMCGNEECPSADRVARMLKDFGHSNVRVLWGGWEAYQRSGVEGRTP